MSQSSVPDSDFAISLSGNTAHTGGALFKSHDGHHAKDQVEQTDTATTTLQASSSLQEMPRKAAKRRKTASVVSNTCMEEGSHNPSSPPSNVDPEDWWDAADPSKVDMVRGALHVSAAALPGRLPSCRAHQVTAIQHWLDEHLANGKGGSLYVSGPPGTGKSLTVAELVRRCGLDTSGLSSPTPIVRLLINCMQLTEPRHVAERILAGIDMAPNGKKGMTGIEKQGGLITVPETCSRLTRSTTQGGEGSSRRLSMSDVEDALTRLQRVASRPTSAHTGKRRRWSMSGADTYGTPAIIVILDEMDSLLSAKDGDDLVGNLFSVAHSPGSRLLLIGIANSIDLVQQALRPGGPFHRRNIHPAHEIFPSYKRDDIASLLNERLSQLPGPVFDKNSIEFCARKIANGDGDMRRALEAAWKAMEECVLHPTANGSDKGNSMARCRVTMRHMNVALGKVTGGIGLSNENVAALRSLPVPQQVLMCTVAKLLGEVLPGRGLAVEIKSMKSSGNGSRHLMGMRCAHGLEHSNAGGTTRGDLGNAWRRRSECKDGNLKRTKELTVGDLQVAFKGLCKQIGVAEYTPAEFGTAMDLLSTLGLIHLGKGSAQSNAKRKVALAVPEDDVMMALSDVPVLKSVVGMEGN